MEALSEEFALHDLLVAFQPVWSALKYRYDRSEHFDAHLAREYKEVNGQMDDLLEQYFTETLGNLALQGIDHVQIIEAHSGAGE